MWTGVQTHTLGWNEAALPASGTTWFVYEAGHDYRVTIEIEAGGGDISRNDRQVYRFRVE